MDIEAEIARTLAEYLVTDFEHGPFSDTSFARAEVEPDGMVSLFASDSESAWPVASFDAPQLAEWIARSPLLNRVRAEARAEAFREAREAINHTRNVPSLITLADKFGGYHQGQRSGLEMADGLIARIEQNSEGNET